MPAPATAQGDRLGDLLVREGLITKDQLDKLGEEEVAGSPLTYYLLNYS